MVNKFNIHWQIARVEARAHKNVGDKIIHVLAFLNSNKNIHNYERVMNWLRMTSVAYKDRDLFNQAIVRLEQNKSLYASTIDADNDLTKVNVEDLRKVYNDLSKRKYGFQFKKVPKDHIDFMEKLKKYV